MQTRWRALSLAVLGLLAALLVTFPARAGDDDDALRTAQEVLDGDYTAGNWGDARQKLEGALSRCGRCAPETQAPLHIILGMIASQLGQKAETRTQFQTALKANPNAQLPSRTTPDIRSEWDQAKSAVAAAAPPKPAPSPPSSDDGSDANGGGDEPPADQTPPPSRPTAPTTPSAPDHIPGWDNVKAFQEANAGLAADTAGKLDECIEHDKKSLDLEEQPRTRLHLCSCEGRSAHLVDALRDAQKALEAGMQHRDTAVMNIARARVEQLIKRIPHVTFQPPDDADDLAVTFDERQVPVNALKKRFSIDPGTHKVHAEGTRNGVSMAFDQEYQVAEGQLLTVSIELSAESADNVPADKAGYLTPGQLKCMLGAKNQDDVLKCVPQKSKLLVIKAGTQLSAYSDTTSVEVWSPEIDANISSPTQGWNIGAHLLVDVVSAASPDIVSEASPPYHEQRYAGGIDGGYKHGQFGINGQVNYSTEPDYTSGGGGLAFTLDLNDKLVTPRFAVNYNADRIGRGPNNFLWSLGTTELEGGSTFILNATSLLLISATAQFESGDQSKPYRYVPMFDPNTIAAGVPPGASPAWVNANRVQARPVEQLPLSRQRFAIGSRFAHRFSKATLRLEERIYADSWQVKASTTDARYIVDVDRRMELWPHARFNAQSGANFYKLAYTAVVDSNTQLLDLPTYRTTDRELSPSVSITIGGGCRYLLSPPDAPHQYSMTFQSDILYGKYFDSLYITQRSAIYATMGFEAEFE